MRARKLWFAIVFGFLYACGGGGGGCPGQAGGPCDPNEKKCEYGYYCAAVGVCTKRCMAAAECQENRACTDSKECKAGETCTNGLCGEVLECIDTYCQRSCAAPDGGGGCTYDPYMPWDREGDPK